jgi:cyclic dehypoxanthinyl futalosine synthase
MISRSEAIDLFRSDDLIGVGMQADSLRRQLHPAGVVTYLVDCAVDGSCTDVEMKIDATAGQGGTGIRFEGVRDVDFCEGLLRWARDKFPRFSLALASSDVESMGGDAALARLCDAGLESVAGDGLEVHRAAHSQGLRTTATMTFGTGESPEALVDRLEAVRQVQLETGGFVAFIPLMKEDVTAVEYLKTLAISRIYLENILNIQISSSIPGLKTTQLGLRFGANDIGSVPLGQNTEEDLRHIIRDAGFVPKQRDSLFRSWFLN